MEIARRNSDQHVARSKSEAFVDMDLAYGDIPPPLPEKRYDDVELKEKASKIEMLLDEANALQFTATAIIENLQKNPEALAAVSLTLAEISAIVGKMGPGVLLTLKGSFPAVAALLLSPQFMIAGGVAVGVTIVALGGYKIIKKIQAQKEVEAPIPMAAMPVRAPIEDSNNQLDELEPQELSRVEMWRRGIADVEANSVISVDRVLRARLLLRVCSTKTISSRAVVRGREKTPAYLDRIARRVRRALGRVRARVWPRRV
jgi:hypothetical protein